MSENICVSGGAQGADSLFAACALLREHKVRHLSFPKHGVHSKIGEKVDVVTGNEQFWDLQLKLVNEGFLNRPIDGMAEYSRNLLRRNMAIAHEVESLYAVTYLSENLEVGGGTAWGVYMAHMRNIPVYLYDQVTKRWYWNCHQSVMDVLIPADGDIPKPEDAYGAIGSRKLTDDGIEAIKSLYGIRE